MKKKGFRIPFRAVACLTVLSRVSFAAGAGAPTGEGQSTVEAGQRDRALEGERLAQAVQEAKRSRHLPARLAPAKYWLFDAAESDSFAEYFFPRSPSRFVFALLPQPSATVLTSGTLTATTTSYSYSTAPWVLSTGDGPYPDLGGTATFNPIIGLTAGTTATSTTVTTDVSPNLSGINFNSPQQYLLTAGTSTSIVAASSGLTINSGATAQNVYINGIGVSYAFGSQISSPISGGGSAGVTKTGTGNVYILGTNTYTGGTHFNGGFYDLGGSSDAVLGATGTGNDLSFNGGTVLFATTGGLTTARNIFIDTGGASIITNTATTFSGVISGSGTLNDTAFSSTTLTLTGANTFTGALVERGPNSQLSGFPTIVLSGNGVLNAAGSYDLMSTFTLTNTGTNVLDRVSDTAPVTLRGVNFIDTGNATATSSETIGAVTTANGFSTFLVTPGTTAANSLTMASLARQNNSTIDFRGTGLGGTPGNTVSNIYVTSAPTLVGGGGISVTGTPSTTISILPYAIGNLGTTTTFTAAGQVGSSFVTYGTTGVRPLATNEYATAFGGNATDNVRLTSTTATAGSGVTANSLLYAPSTTGTLSGGTINLTSGAFLYSPTADATGTVTAAINFGTAEGVVTATSALNFNGNLSGSGGLTITSTSAPTNNYTANFALNGASTFTGNTTINAGAVTFLGTIASGTAGPFGTNGTVILNAGRILASLVPGGATTFNSNISVIGYGQNYISPGGSGFTSTFNGNISLSNNLNLEGYSNAAASALIFNGVISGTGSITDVSYTYGVFNGNNTYSGGTFLSGSTSTSNYYAGSDTAFGTGTITFNGPSVLSGAGTTARTLANPLFFNATGYIGGTAPLTFTGPVTLNGTRLLSITNTALTTFSGVVANGSLTKSTGTGTLVLGSATGNTYSGGTVVGSGTLLVTNTSGSGTGSGSVSVTSGATLGGTGFIVNTVPNGSTATTTSIPSGATLLGGNGTATGALTLNGNLTLASGSIIALGLATDGTHSSLARAGGVWTLPSGINFTFTGSPTVGQTYNGLLTGLAADPGTESGWVITNSGFTGTFVYDPAGSINLTMTAVPEPATVFGGLACAAALGWHLRRRAQRRSAARA